MGPRPPSGSPAGRRAGRIGLVGCVKSKQGVPARAAELYTSPLFIGRRRWVEGTCDRWFVLSALHGLLDPAAVIAPYDVALTRMGRRVRRDWSVQVLARLTAELGSLGGRTFEIHAGAAYRDHGLVDGLVAAGAAVELPVEGLPLGGQLARYALGPDGAEPATGPGHGPALRSRAVGLP